MNVSDDLLNKLESLSLLQVLDRERMKVRLGEVIGFINEIVDLDLCEDGLEEDLFTPLREDFVLDADIIQDVISHAPLRDEEYFVVPRIIE